MYVCLVRQKLTLNAAQVDQPLWKVLDQISSDELDPDDSGYIGYSAAHEALYSRVKPQLYDFMHQMIDRSEPILDIESVLSAVKSAMDDHVLVEPLPEPEELLIAPITPMSPLDHRGGSARSDTGIVHRLRCCLTALLSHCAAVSLRCCLTTLVLAPLALLTLTLLHA